jgi:hypothetical protein
MMTGINEGFNRARSRERDFKEEEGKNLER